MGIFAAKLRVVPAVGLALTAISLTAIEKIQ
jgi:hypothetical protein